jgi:hypothetical protein
MLARLLRRVRDAGRAALSGLRRRLLAATQPAVAAPVAGTLADLIRSRPELVAENALLRQHRSCAWPHDRSPDILPPQHSSSLPAAPLSQALKASTSPHNPTEPRGAGPRRPPP